MEGVEGRCRGVLKGVGACRSVYGDGRRGEVVECEKSKWGRESDDGEDKRGTCWRRFVDR